MSSSLCVATLPTLLVYLLQLSHSYCLLETFQRLHFLQNTVFFLSRIVFPRLNSHLSACRQYAPTSRGAEKIMNGCDLFPVHSEVFCISNIFACVILPLLVHYIPSHLLTQDPHLPQFSLLSHVIFSSPQTIPICMQWLDDFFYDN